MKMQCEVIQDLLPLYVDGVCSETSRQLVEEHLKDCKQCQDCLNTLRSDSQIQHRDDEYRKADSLRKVHHRIVFRQLLAAGIAVCILLGAGLGIRSILRSSVQVITDPSVLSVNEVDGSLIGRLQGSSVQELSITRVQRDDGDVLFFSLTDTRWDEMMTGDTSFSEFTLCAKDKNAAVVQAVYYLSEDHTGLESMDENQIAEVMKRSTLLWHR
ncbi:MAG: zf-HC2 domain-containing protein [Bulleidia sp.]